MSSFTHSAYSPDASGYITGRPSRRPPISDEEDPSEEDPSEDVGLEQEVSSMRNDTPIRSPEPLPPQSSPRGAFPRQTARMRVPMPREARYSLTDPYFPPAEGPSNVMNRYTWERHMTQENMLRRSANGETPRVVTGVPAVHGSGIIPDEQRQMRSMAAALHHCVARANHQGELMYEMSEIIERATGYAFTAMETASQARMTIRRLMWLCFVLGIMMLMIVLVFLYMIAF